MAISGKGEGKAGRGQGYKVSARVPRARGRLDWSMICIATATSDINSTKERPVAATLALLQIRLALWLGEITNHAGGNIVVARNFRHDTGGPRSPDESGQIARTSQPCRPTHE